MNNLEYAGFWICTAATLIDTALLLIVTMPPLLLIYGQNYMLSEAYVHGSWDLLFSHVMPAVAVILFWTYKSATPGKMAFSLTLVDAQTGGKPSTGQLIGSYFAYLASLLPLGFGLIWVGIDKRKQGLHDKLAGTVVVRNMVKEPVRFDG